MKKDLKIIELFDLYCGLLTNKQREIFKAYYLYDLSLAEIAEPEGTTRQSVHEMIKSTTDKLLFFDSVLKLKDINEKLIEVAEQSSDKEIAEKIRGIISR